MHIKKYLILILIVFMSALSFFAYLRYDNRISAILHNEEELVHVTYSTIIDAYQKNADILFATAINNDEVLEIFYKASKAKDLDIQNKYRKQLYNKLSSKYKKLKKFDIKQLHFHLKNNDSFLRFHRPNKFGDNLSKVRKTVVFVNREKKRTIGFEEGKIFNGYRFVFPLSYKNEHIGSMELSISMQAIISAIKQNINSNIDFIIDKQVVDTKVFKSESCNYVKSDLSVNYLHEMSINPLGNKDIKEAVNAYKNTNDDYEKKLKDGKIFSFTKKIDKKYKIITFYPIKNIIENKTVAYVVISTSNKEIQEVQNIFISIWFGLLFLSIIVLISFYRVDKAKQIANEATNSKSLFLANMSHEIRTPMNAIIGFSDILKKTKLDENQKKYLQYIESSSVSLLDIINDILDFSKIEAGKLEIETIPFSMHKLNDDLYALLSILAKVKNIEFKLQYNSSYEGDVLGDSTRIRQIIINLVNNAIKFTKKGSVKVIVNTLTESHTQIFYEIKIVDTGIGISKENIPKLFASFTQAELETNRKFGGTGLGLSITKSLLTMMKGKIIVKSELGHGSEFIIKIKFLKDLSIKKEDKGVNIERIEDFSPLKVLVAEDNKTNQVLIDIILDEYNIDTTIVNDGQEAVDILKTTEFDLVLMDIQMPKLDGYSATRIIRDKESDVLNHNICIVALSANAMISDIDLSLKAGMNNHLAKPIDKEKLYEVLLQNLKEKEKNG